MEIQNFLSELSERDSCSDETGFWECSVKVTNSIIEQEPLCKELTKEVKELKTKVDNFEAELMSNSEAAQKMREITSIRKNIEEEETKLENMKIDEALLKEEIKGISSSNDSLIKNVESMEKQDNTLKETINNLRAELINKEEQNHFGKKSLDTVTEQYSRMKIEEDKLISQLMRLKEREADIMNEPFLSKTNAPKVDLSQYKVPLPTSQNKGSHEHDDSDGDNDLMQSAQFMKTIKQEPTTQKHSGSITALCFANAQPYFASGAEDAIVNIVKTDNFTRIASLSESPKTIMSIAFSPSDRMMLTAAYDGVVRFYRTPDFKLINTNSDNRECVNSVAFITDDKFVTCCRNQTIKLFDISNSAPITSLTAASTANCIFPLQGESLVITAHHDGRIRGYDLRAEGVPFEIRVHKKSAIQVTGRIGGSRVISLSADKTIANIDIRGRNVLGSINIQQAGMPSEKMQMALVDTSAIVGSTSGDIFDYDITSYQLSTTTKAHSAPLFCVAANQSMGLLATGDKNGVVKFWNH